MKRIVNHTHLYRLIILMFCCASCMEYDLYDPPTETITGSVIDANTGLPIQTEQPNGIRIRLEETSWSETPEPLYFWAKPDGTFQNTKLFKGTYVVTPVDGPYFPVEGKTVEIGDGAVNVNFEVEPFLNLEVIDVEQDGGNLAIRFRINRSSPSFKITDARVFISPTRFASNSTFLANKSGQILSPQINFNSVDDEVVLAETHTLSVAGLEGGNRKYYVRVGARTNDNVQKRYNYAEALEITVP